MKYKVWGKAKSLIKPKKHHYLNFMVILFVVGLLFATGIAVRLGMLYAGTFYSGVREPYIQSLSSHSVVIRWQSEELVKSKVIIKKASEINSDEDVIKKQEHLQSSHAVSFTQLEPATRYYYKIYHDQKLFRAGADYWFETAPETGIEAPVRIWLLGDPGRAGEEIESVQSAMLDWVGANPRQDQPALNMIISTGDNGYERGSNKEYQQGLFSIHQQLFKNTVFWPVYGNHDAKGWSFFKVFSLPKQAEAGGVASGTEHYYSVDYANLHLIFLDSNEGGFSTDDEMMKWLEKDLQTTKQKWLLVFMHHPPYTRGSHNSNDARDSGNRMFNMRMRVLPVLEQYGVDMVVAGHSHSYERSYLMDCHYSVSSGFKQKNILQKGPQFIKPLHRSTHQGAVYTVLGSSAEAIAGRFDHPAMAVANANLGSMILDVEKNKLVARFIDNTAKVLDQFEIIKSEKMKIAAESDRLCH